MKQPIGSSTVFDVSNIDRSLDFYTNTLGFKVEFAVGEPTIYVGMSWGEHQLAIGSELPYVDAVGRGHMYLVFEEVDSIYTVLTEAGHEFYSSIDDREYGMRDFCVKDPDGNQVGFGCCL